MAVIPNAYGKAKDGFRGYAREVARKGTNSLTGDQTSRQRQAFALGSGPSSNQAVKGFQNSANQKMQSKLQGMGAQRQAAARKAAMNSQLARLNSARTAAPAAARPSSGASSTAYRATPTAAPRQSSGAASGTNRRM